MNKVLITIIALIAGAGLGYYFGFDMGWEKATLQNQSAQEANKTNKTNEQPQENNNQQNTQPGSPDAGRDTLQEHPVLGFYGSLTLTGYLSVQTRECKPGDMCGETVEYASFVYTDGSNEALKKFTGTFDGNSYVAGDRVGLGCYQKNQNRIYYLNDADDTGMIEGTIAGEDLSRLLSSSQNNPVRLKLTKPIYTSGRGAPDCYSHFRNFDVL